MIDCFVMPVNQQRGTHTQLKEADKFDFQYKLVSQLLGNQLKGV